MAIMKEFISWVIRQKGESQNGCFKKAKHSKFSEKRTFLTSGMFTYACVSGVRNIRFFGKFGVLFFLETHVLRFALFPYYRRYLVRNVLHNAFVFKTPLSKFSWRNFFAEPKKMDGWNDVACLFISNSIFLSQRQVVHRRC